MELGVLARTSGTWINVGAVLLGTFLGLILLGRLPLRMQRIMVQGVGLTTLYIGFSMSGSLTGVRGGPISGTVLGLICMVIGGLIGEWVRLEEWLNHLGEILKQRLSGSNRFSEGFVTASLLFCVGPMSLIGAINNGLTGDQTLLVLKSALDGLSAIALSSSLGIGVGFSALVILVYQGGISLLAGVMASALPHPAADPRIMLITGVGGLMIVGLGINLLELGRIRVASFLPALLIAAPLWAFFAWIA